MCMELAAQISCYWLGYSPSHDSRGTDMMRGRHEMIELYGLSTLDGVEATSVILGHIAQKSLRSGQPRVVASVEQSDIYDSSPPKTGHISRGKDHI